MTAKQGALWAAGRGLRVFRVVPNGKQPFRRGINEATTDPATIEKWFASHPDLNYGISTDGRVVLDVDPRKNPDGWYEELCELGDLPETLTGISPTGGMHIWLDGFDASQKPLSHCIDIRSTGGYVVGPGSIIDGRPYRLHCDGPIAPLPDHLRARLKPSGEKTEDTSTPAAELDTPGALQWAEAYVRKAPAAVLGGRNAKLFQLAAVLKDKGLSSESTLALLLEHWCPRCDPPYEDEGEIEKSVASAYNNGQRQPGSEAPELEFENLANVVELAQWREKRAQERQDGQTPAPQPVSAAMLFRPLDLSREPSALPRRRYLFQGQLERGTVGCIVGPGGGNKSALSNCLALGVALGDADFIGFRVVGGPQSVLIINNEDSADEVTRRLTATCMANSLDRLAANGRVHIYDAGDAANFLAAVRDPKTKELRRTMAYRRLFEYINDCRIAFYTLDPFKSVHTGQENDNTDVDLVARAFVQLSKQTDAVGFIVHHSKKAGVGGTDAVAGDIDSARGASALANAVRRAWTLYTMSREDAVRYGLGDDDRLQHVRLDGAKGNYAKRTASPRWYKAQTVALGNGDDSFALMRVDLSDQEQHRRNAVFTPIIEAVLAAGEDGITMNAAIGAAKADPLLSSMSDTTLRRRLEEMLSDPYVFGDKRLFWDAETKRVRVEAHP